MIEVLHPTDDAERIEELRRAEYGLAYVDGWATARSELIAIDSFSSLPLDWNDERVVDSSSRFIHFPWRSTLVRLPDSEHFYRLRTARNRFLLDNDEQTSWGSALIGIAGLSVGSSVAAVCSLTGARRFRVADPDTLGPSNLNRLQGSVCDLGVSKVTLAQRRILEIDPYSDVSGFLGGYSSTDGTFLRSSGDERVAVLVEEMDDLAMKLAIRLEARALQIPVVMATDNGDNVILDVERYDRDADYPPFHGRAGDLTACSESELNEPANRTRLANAIVGSDVTPRTRYSLTQVGRTLPSWPQLGTAANAAGSTAALAARLMVSGADIQSGRYRVDLDHILLGESALLATRWNELDESAFVRSMAQQ